MQNTKPINREPVRLSLFIQGLYFCLQTMQSTKPVSREPEKRSKKPGKSDERRNVAKDGGEKVEENVAVKEIDENSNSKPMDKEESKEHDLYQVRVFGLLRKWYFFSISSRSHSLTHKPTHAHTRLTIKRETRIQPSVLSWKFTSSALKK